MALFSGDAMFYINTQFQRLKVVKIECLEKWRCSGSTSYGHSLKEQVKQSILNEMESFIPYCERLADNGMANKTVSVDGADIYEFDFNEDHMTGTMEFNYIVDYWASCKDMRDIDYESAERVFKFKVDLVTKRIIFEPIKLPLSWQPDIAIEQ